MKNKILKPIISIGFATKGSDSGKIRVNIDRNKLNNLNSNNLDELKRQLTFAVNAIKLEQTVTTPHLLNSKQKVEIEYLINTGMTLGAIKAYKEYTGIGLKEAKEYIVGYKRTLDLFKK